MELALGGNAAGRLGLDVPLEGTLAGEACVQGTPAATVDLAGDPRFPAGPWRYDGLGPAVAVPLGRAGGPVDGVLLLARWTAEAAFTDRRSGHRGAGAAKRAAQPRRARREPGGAFELASPESGGTRLAWSVPLVH